MPWGICVSVSQNVLTMIEFTVARSPNVPEWNPLLSFCYFIYEMDCKLNNPIFHDTDAIVIDICVSLDYIGYFSGFGIFFIHLELSIKTTIQICMYWKCAIFFLLRFIKSNENLVHKCWKPYLYDTSNGIAILSMYVNVPASIVHFALNNFFLLFFSIKPLSVILPIYYIESVHQCNWHISACALMKASKSIEYCYDTHSHTSNSVMNSVIRVSQLFYTVLLPSFALPSHNNFILSNTFRFTLFSWFMKKTNRFKRHNIIMVS